MTVAMPKEAASGAPQTESLAELFAALESPLLAYAMKLVQQSETAQDLVQEAFVRLHGEFESVRQPRPWLYRTIHNLAANHHRKHRKIVPLTKGGGDDGAPIEWPDDAPTPDEALQRLEAADHTRRCLETLDERSRHLIRLKFEEKHSYRRISELTGISIGNVGYILHHALKQLADELKRKGVAP
ncbi:sigma-70 family RNA polymerase sigma factor [bacterium]|nr:sigma-70 family RNA polymerase sigma factor [bacterium]